MYTSRQCTTRTLLPNRSFAFRSGFVQRLKIRRPKAEPENEKTGSEKNEDPVWIRREKMRTLQKEQKKGFELPFFVSLPLSGVIAIAAVGSMFEIFNRKPLFGVLPPENPLWLPILAFFAVTGLPVSGYFFFSSVAAANRLAEQMDEIDKA